MNLGRLKKHLRVDEGEVLYPYRCPAGKLTIGVGRNIEDNGFTVDEMKQISESEMTPEQFVPYLKEHGITEEDADMLLENDTRKCIKQAKWILSEGVWEQLSDVRKEVVISMIFNMGAGSFKGFVDVIKNIKLGLHYKAYMEMQDSEYYKNSVTHNRAHKLSESYKNNRWVDNG